MPPSELVMIDECTELTPDDWAWILEMVHDAASRSHGFYRSWSISESVSTGDMDDG